MWTDPDFDPSLHAFYYARVLEIPTPRWSTIQAKQLGIAPPDVVPATQQERAWSSPIWYTPTAEAREAAAPGLTVADLTENGATALTEDELKALIVGKAIWVRNNVTGEDMKIRYDEDGTAVILHVGRERAAAEPVRRPAAALLPDHGGALRDQRRQDRDLYLQHADRHGGLQVHGVAGWQRAARAGDLLRRAQQRVRLRQLRDPARRARRTWSTLPKSDDDPGRRTSPSTCTRSEIRSE